MKTAEDMIGDQKTKLVTVSPDVTIQEALKTMTSNNIGAILVEEATEIVGIWTERDLMRNILVDGFNPETALIKDYMTQKLHFARHDDTIYKLFDQFLGLRIRHLLVKKDGVFLGMVSSGDVTRHALNDKTEEFQKLNKMVSWEYYENWQW